MKQINSFPKGKREHYTIMYDDKFLEVFINYTGTLQIYLHNEITSELLYSHRSDIEHYLEMLTTNKPVGVNAKFIEKIDLLEEFNDPSKFKIVKVILEQTYFVYEDEEK